MFLSAIRCQTSIVCKLSILVFRPDIGMLCVMISTPRSFFLGMELSVDVLSYAAGIDVGVDDCCGCRPLRRCLLVIWDAVDVWCHVGVCLDAVKVSLLVPNLHAVT